MSNDVSRLVPLPEHPHVAGSPFNAFTTHVFGLLGRLSPGHRANGRFRTGADAGDHERTAVKPDATDEWLRSAIENAHEFAIFSTNLDGRVTTWSPGAERITGYCAGEARGRRGDFLCTPADQTADASGRESETALAEGRAATERWFQRKDGSLFWGSGALMAMHGPRGQATGFVRILRDRTEERRNREALKRSRAETEAARAEADAALLARDRFTATLAHELRTPLVPITLAMAALDTYRDLPEAVREAHGMIQRNVEVATRLIEDMLDLARTRHGKLEVAHEPLDLHAVLHRAVEVATPDLAAKAQRLTIVLEAEKCRANGDFVRLQPVFWNLLKNASKFTPRGGDITVCSRCVDGREQIIEISDTGIGMEAETIARVFEPFEQGSPAITRTFGGLGLGLSIAKAAVEAHGGSLHARSDWSGSRARLSPCGCRLRPRELP